MTSVDEERRLNPRLSGETTCAQFVSIMREFALAYPKYIDVALPRNVRCGMAVEPAPQGGDRA